LGGDKRGITAMKRLEDAGFAVESRGLFPGDDGDIEKADIIILPIPSTKDGRTVFCPLTNEIIPLDRVKNAAKGRFVITANYDFGENFTDILKLDGFAFLNAVPTAEGAIAYAVSNTPFTLWKSKILIIGNGRVARVLKDRLSGFGCHLTVSARKFKDFALLDTQNTKYIDTADVSGKAGGFDIIFNTVDAPLFPSPEVLKNALLIDLSSRGCIDFEAAKEKGINAVKLPAIPGRTAPETAGDIYAETLISVICLGERT
ncbi:MAG: hypothetical protein J5766_05460, partial [Clostridia bacterium]|nr:hypothetical protein [Clostridia bacterium]